MKRILLDQGFSPRTASLLRNAGWDAVHVMEVGLDRAEDIAILDFARKQSRTCVTLDHDFHAHLAIAQTNGPSVVFVRLEGLDTNGQVELICQVWQRCEDAIERGAAITVSNKAIRIRHLPLR